MDPLPSSFLKDLPLVSQAAAVVVLAPLGSLGPDI